MYDVIVLGATFAAAGLARKLGDKCLVLERRLQAGYEFFDALNFGAGYDKAVRQEEARQLQQDFLRQGTGFYCCDAYIYPFFHPDHTMFAAQLVSVEKKDGVFECVTHGVDGFRTYTARQVVDTRCDGSMSTSKTYNLLVKSEEVPVFANVAVEKGGMEDHYILRCPVPLSWGYTEARKAAMALIGRFSETQRLVLSANEFDYRVRDGYPKTEDGIRYLPSKAYENPVLAFEAGLCMGEEMSR